MTAAASSPFGRLISAEKLTGARIFDCDGNPLGRVAGLMIDRVSGRAVYAMISFGGILGIGDRHRPLPWSTLRYDAQKAGYVVIPRDAPLDAGRAGDL